MNRKRPEACGSLLSWRAILLSAMWVSVSAIFLSSCSGSQDAADPDTEAPPSVDQPKPDPTPVPTPPAVDPSPVEPDPVTPSPEPTTPPAPPPVSAADQAPSTYYNLKNWKLTLPVDAKGDVDGIAAEVMNLKDYKSKYFHTAADEGMVFRAPANGATTQNSQYPRSELREMLSPYNAAVNWSDADHAILVAELKVDRVPASGRLIVGQIHAFQSPRPLLKLQYEYASGNGTVTAWINETWASERSIKLPLATGIARGERFDYRIEVNNRKLSISVNGDKPKTYAINPAWEGMGMFFKAGVYLQVHSSDASDYGQTTFYQLVAKHSQD